MESYDEIMTTLSEMESRYHDGFSSSDRLLLDKLHRAIFGKEITNTGCSDCYRDAYLLVKIHLNKTKKMPTKPNYVLKAGGYIHPVGTNKYYTNPITNDEIAEDYLSKFPGQIIIFAEYPSDWEARVAAYKARKADNEASAEAEVKAQSHDLNQAREAIAGYQEEQKKILALLDEKNALISAKDEEIERLNHVIAEKDALIAQAAETPADEDGDNEVIMELETARTELEAANKEIAELKSENRALKAANTRLKNNNAKDAE